MFVVMANTPMVGVRVPETIQKELRAVASARGLSLSAFMREAALAALADQAIDDHLGTRTAIDA